MNYRLLVVDIDGTLVGNERTVSTKDKDALAKARRLGIQVSLSTGRVTKASLDILSQLSLDGYHIFFDGALVSNPDNSKEVYVQPLSPTIVKQAIEFAHRNDTCLELYSASHYFVEQESWSVAVHRQFFGLEPTVVDFSRLWNRERIIKAQLVVSSPQEADKVKDFRLHFNEAFHFSVAKSPAFPDTDFINVVSPEVSKGRALEALASYMGIALSEVMAIGDGTNDISLFSRAGLAVAMGNAPAEVKAVADQVTLDVEHNGLFAAIEKFLL